MVVENQPRHSLDQQLRDASMEPQQECRGKRRRTQGFGTYNDPLQ